MNSEIVSAVLVPQVLMTLIDIVIIAKMLTADVEGKAHKFFNLFGVMVCLMQGNSALLYAADYGIISLGIGLLYPLYIISLCALTLVSYYWFLYFVSSLGNEAYLSRWARLVYFLPVAMMLLTACSSYWTHWVFYLDEQLVYHKGSFYFLQMACPYFYILFSLVLALIGFRSKNRKEVIRLLRLYLVSVIPSAVGAVLQMSVFRGGYTQLCISLGMILMYLELYVEQVEEAKRLRSIEALNHQLEENQALLEKSNAEQEAQLEEITALNERLMSDIDIIYSMANVYFSAYYIDLEKDSFTELKTKDNIKQRVGSSGNVRQAIKVLCTRLVQPEFSEIMTEFMDLDTIDQRLSESKYVAMKYKGVTSGWSQAYLIEVSRDDNGKLKNIIYATRAIHIEKALEEEHERSIQEAREAAESANKAKTSFLFNMSHDIRTPMNAIMGFTNLLRKHQEEPDKREDYLDKIEGASNVLLSIINNVLEMARIEKGTIEMDEIVWSADQFNDTLQSVFQEMMAQKGIEFTRHIDVKNPYVMCDPVKLREIFFNILSNAYKYTPTGGKVHMLLEEVFPPQRKEGYAYYRTTISDTGIGMSEEFLPHLYEEFSRENRTTDSKIEGTGLGMPIVKRLVELMNGTIEVKSQKGVGTTFIVTIPHKIADRSSLVDHAGVVIDPKIFEGKHLLLAEDNELNAEIAIEILSEVGFIIDLAEDGHRCVEMLQESAENYYSVILMDIQMPNMNGYDATRAIRSLSDHTKSRIPILAMTANAFEEDKREAVSAGMNGHLAKPINIPELMKELTRVIK